MPELPEVETMRRGIDDCIGCQIVAVQRPRCRLKPITIAPTLPTLRHRIVGTTIVKTDRAGKRVVVCLDSDDALVFEPRMTGLVLVADPPNTEHLRLCIQLDSQTKKSSTSQLLYWDRRGLGSVKLFSAEQFTQAFGPARLGPDAIDVTGKQLRDRLESSRRAIKVALLDQAAVAGIGNLYAAEILCLAKIHPQTACSQLRPADWQRIADATHSILAEAIRYEGSTLGDGTYRNALNHEGRYQNHHRVYDRAGQRCGICSRGKVKRIVQCQRSTFYCPCCQRLRR